MPLDGLQLRHYQLQRLIGNGGMGEIYLARDLRLERQVAVKVVRADISLEVDAEESAKVLRLFQREARTISMLDHPHILPLFDYGEVAYNEAQLTYLVMPYHPEGSLDIWLRKRRQATRLPPSVVAPIIRQAADALQYAHEQRIVHQDVKSSNFLVSSSSVTPDAPHLLLSDFGLARLRSGNSNSSKHARGTPNYMAPEQWRGEAVPASDQYSLAIMAYKLLTGRYPFAGDAVSILYQHLQAPPPDASQLNPDVPAQLAVVIQLAMAKQPDERFPSIAAFAQAVEQALHSMPIEVVERSTSVHSQLLNMQAISGAYTSPSTSDLYKERQRSPITLGDLPFAAPEQDSEPSVPDLPLVLPDEASEPHHRVSVSPPSQVPPFAREEKRHKPGRRGRLLILIAALVLLFVILGGYILAISMKSNAGGVQSDVPTRVPGVTATAQVTTTAHNKVTVTPTPTVKPVVYPPATSGTATPIVSATPTTTDKPVSANTFQVRTVDITFDPPTASGSCLSIVTVTYIVTITVNTDNPGGVVAFKYSSDNGQSYTDAELTFAPGETSKTYTFSRQLVLSIQLGALGLDLNHTGIVTTTSPNTMTQQATPQVGCS